MSPLPVKEPLSGFVFTKESEITIMRSRFNFTRVIRCRRWLNLKLCKQYLASFLLNVFFLSFFFFFFFGQHQLAQVLLKIRLGAAPDNSRENRGTGRKFGLGRRILCQTRDPPAVQTCAKRDI